MSKRTTCMTSPKLLREVYQVTYFKMEAALQRHLDIPDWVKADPILANEHHVVQGDFRVYGRQSVMIIHRDALDELLAVLKQYDLRHRNGAQPTIHVSPHHDLRTPGCPCYAVFLDADTKKSDLPEPQFVMYPPVVLR